LLCSGDFGGLKWSNGEGHLMYVAEKMIKTAQYFDGDLDWSSEEKMQESNVVLQLLLLLSFFLCD
jgi:hypothetical protein